jgi:hypothetical protein
MKFKATQEKETFKPIVLTITFENKNELDWYRALFGLTKQTLVEIDDDFCSLKDPDPNGSIIDLLDIMEQA